jgi:hypothetical protein
MFITYLANAPLNTSGVAASLDVLLLRASRTFSAQSIMAEKPSNVKQERLLTWAMEKSAGWRLKAAPTAAGACGRPEG